MVIGDFRCIALLGQGAFGKVFLVQNSFNIHRNSKLKLKKYPEQFAMKVIQKDNIWSEKVMHNFLEN